MGDMKFGQYKGKQTRIKEIDSERFKTLQLDAKRIMGLEPALSKSITRPTLSISPTFLTPPEEGSGTWEYATRILALKEPVVEVWIGYPLIVERTEITDWLEL